LLTQLIRNAGLQGGVSYERKALTESLAALV